jgi:hypothetical protein
MDNNIGAMIADAEVTGRLVADAMREDGLLPKVVVDARLSDAAPALLAACKAMIACCGGSQNWNGETHRVLVLMETAVAKACEKRTNREHVERAVLRA